MNHDNESDEREAIVKAMINATMPPLREPGDFTLSEFLEAVMDSGYQLSSRRTAQERLNAEVEAGRLAKLTVWDNKLMRAVKVYRPIEKGADQ